MNYRAIRYYLGQILGVEAILMLPALICSLLYREYRAVQSFVMSILLLCAVAVCFLFIKQEKKQTIQSREGLLIVGLSWVLLSLFGALPFYFSGDIPHYIDAFFETVSGFTTTGASILSNVEGLQKGMLFWRSFTHLIGGMGVLVFLLAIVPLSKGNGETLHLMRAESPGPSVGKVTPTMSKTARTLYGIYMGITTLTVILLLISGMPLFDALCTAFGAAGTGGFAVKNIGMNAYSAASQAIVAVAMLLFGINFSLYYLILTGQWKNALKDEELRWYLLIVLCAVMLIGWNIKDQFSTLQEALHHSFFTVSSIITTTGFATADFNLWPELSKWVLIILMVLGACAGSTGGGTKISRLVILMKSVKNELLYITRPRCVRSVRINKKPVDSGTVRGVQIFYVLYFFIALLSMLLLSLDNFDGVSTFSSVFACLSNIGPGLNMVGPTGNYALYSSFGKLLLSLDMLLGRLELYPILLLFIPSAWNRRG